MQQEQSVYKTFYDFRFWIYDFGLFGQHDFGFTSLFSNWQLAIRNSLPLSPLLLLPHPSSPLPSAFRPLPSALCLIYIAPPCTQSVSRIP